MNKPASAPDVIPERKPQPAAVGEESEGSNATRHHPDPKAEPMDDGEHKHIPRTPYHSGND